MLRGELCGMLYVVLLLLCTSVCIIFTNELLNRVGWCFLPCNTMKCLRCCMLYCYYYVRQYVSSLLLSSDVPIVLMAVDCTRLYAKIELPNRVWWYLFTLQYYASDW